MNLATKSSEPVRFVGPVSAGQVAAWFGKLRPVTVQPLLDTLLVLMLLPQTDEGA